MLFWNGKVFCYWWKNLWKNSDSDRIFFAIFRFYVMFYRFGFQHQSIRFPFFLTLKWVWYRIFKKFNWQGGVASRDRKLNIELSRLKVVNMHVHCSSVIDTVFGLLLFYKYKKLFSKLAIFNKFFLQRTWSILSAGLESDAAATTSVKRNRQVYCCFRPHRKPLPHSRRLRLPPYSLLHSGRDR